MVSARREIYGRGGTAEYAFEKPVLQLKITADRVGHQVIAAERVYGRLFTLPVDENQAFGFAYRKRMQDHLIEQRVNGGGCSNSECEREHCRCRKRRTAEKRPRRQAQVARKVPQPSSQPNIAHLLLHLRKPAELDSCLPARFGFTDAGGYEVVGAAFQVITQFAIQVLFHPAPPGPEQNEEPSHGLTPLVENQPDCRREALPALLLDRKLLLARASRRVELGFTARFRLAPLRLQPAFLLKPVQRRVQ